MSSPEAKTVDGFEDDTDRSKHDEIERCRHPDYLYRDLERCAEVLNRQESQALDETRNQSKPHGDNKNIHGRVFDLSRGLLPAEMLITVPPHFMDSGLRIFTPPLPVRRTILSVPVPSESFQGSDPVAGADLLSLLPAAREVADRDLFDDSAAGEDLGRDLVVQFEAGRLEDQRHDYRSPE